MNVYADIVVASWAVFVVVWLISAFFTKRTITSSWFRGWWVRAIVFVFVLVWFVINGPHKVSSEYMYLSGTVSAPALNLLGAILTPIGVAIAVWARYHLGRNWGQPMTLRKEPELVTTGPYAWIRNPIYTGVILGMIGSGFLNYWWFFFAAAAIIYFTWSSLVEERDMLREFPETYPPYKARTWRLVPYIF